MLGCIAGDEVEVAVQIATQIAQEERAELAVRLRKDDGSVVIDGTAEFAVR